MENLKIQKMPFMCISCSMSHVCLLCYPYVRIDISYLFVLVCTSRTRRLQIHICLLWYVINPCIFIQKNQKFQNEGFIPSFSKMRVLSHLFKMTTLPFMGKIEMYVFTYTYHYACHIYMSRICMVYVCMLHIVFVRLHTHVTYVFVFVYPRMHVVFIRMSRTHIIRMSTYVCPSHVTHVYVFVYLVCISYSYTCHVRMSFACHVRMSFARHARIRIRISTYSYIIFVCPYLCVVFVCQRLRSYPLCISF